VLQEVIFKSHDSTLERRDLSTVGVFIPNKQSGFVEVVTLLSLPDGVYYGDKTDLSDV
jgi:hypothetical protein